MDVFFGTDKPLRVRVFGQEQQALEDEATKIAKIVGEVEGVENATVEAPEAAAHAGDRGRPRQGPEVGRQAR